VPLHVAGIGASAGGLEALQALAASLRPGGRVAYVVAQHMADDAHGGLVVRLLARDSALPVVLAGDGDPLRADTLHFIPAGYDGVVRAGRLLLERRGAGSISAPSVNRLFASIAEDCRQRGIGIVLSGAGSDGAAGCRAIKAAGGLTFAQAPEEARFNGMPGAAVAGRSVDRVLPVAAIGQALAELFSPTAAPPVSKPSPGEVAVTPADVRELATLVGLIEQTSGIDFSRYKEETLVRRLAKRKATLGIATADDYLALVRRQPGELRALQQYFLVSVSSFFRNRASFRELTRALAPLLADKPAGEAIRVWVPGCASGEEVYTLAIILSEWLAEHPGRNPVSIIGTDLNPEALAIARAGVYKASACREMDDALRERYLQASGDGWAVTDGPRTMVRFELRDVLSGAPEGGLDLISCRNLLIYMKAPLQDELIRLFHGALRSRGLLLVGEAESIGLDGNGLFVPLSHYHRLFQRRS